jgi:hypothetical protein
MASALEAVLYKVTERLVGYLPNLVAGLLLIAFGWVLGWVVKRIVVQVCVALRIDRLLRGFRWGAAFAKADVRHALFNFIGNVAFFVVFVILFSASLDAMQLTVLSDLVESAVLFVPRLIIAAAIVTLGWVLARWNAQGALRVLADAGVPKAALIAQLVRFVVLLVFAAMALAEINIARDIVVIGFAVIMTTLGALAVVLTAVGGRSFLSRMLGGPGEEDRQRQKP